MSDKKFMDEEVYKTTIRKVGKKFSESELDRQIRNLEQKCTFLTDAITKVNIIANAKAVIVPEGKGVFWTEKIEALENDFFKHQEDELAIEHSTLEEEILELRKWMDLPCRCELVQREFIKEIGNYLDTDRFEYLIKKLSGEKSGWISVDVKPNSSPEANIKQIIELYDNGHENVFYPDTHILVRKEHFHYLYQRATQDEDKETLEEYRKIMKEIMDCYADNS